MIPANRPPQSRTAWLRVMSALIGSGAVWALSRISGTAGMPAAVLVALASLAAWYCAASFVLIDTGARRLWTILLLVSGAVLLLAGPKAAGRQFAAFAGIAFLLVRRRSSCRLLTGSQRAMAFLVGLIVLILLTVDVRTATLPGPKDGWLAGMSGQVARYSIQMLRLFWLLTLLRLFFGMRLHSFRLSTKLAVSALLLALVPAVLELVLGLLAIYGALGGREAVRGRAILQGWAEQTDRGVQLEPVPFAVTFDARFVCAEPFRLGAPSEPPEWMPEFARALCRPAEADSTEREQAWAPADTTAYFQIGRETWLLRVRGVGQGQIECHGLALDAAALEHLAKLLDCDAALYTLEERPLRPGERQAVQMNLGAATDSSTTSFTLIARGRHDLTPAGADSARSFWRRPRVFGGELVPILALRDGRLLRDQVALQLSIPLTELGRGFMERGNELNRVVVIGLMALAVVFLVLEAFALFLGIRITAGITHAVASLRQGTQRLAAGDLDTRIELPNEDEFGELARSFNEMAVAVKLGREEAIARKLLESEIETARAIQQRLLPRAVPAVPGYEISGASVPSRQVGGDYYDYLDLGGGRIGIAIGDVSGKGIPAALLMSNLQACLQGQVIHPGGVDELVALINNLLVRSTDARMFATFFYGVLDCTTSSFNCTNAGHNPPILRRADGTIERLERGGLILGVVPGARYDQETVQLAAGDVLVLFTDGVSEAEGPVPEASAHGAGEHANDDTGDDADDEETERDDAIEADEADEAGEVGETTGELFEEERLIEVVHAHAAESADAMRDAILAAVAAHAAGAPQSDDITLVVVKRRADEG
jgi:serine phosphatase RsbU (regulator of sigma subunit)